ncbi:hypothetical protein [Streptomyces turgidiscabies]|uniref:hypothetical protein n=1 Tax=Streptomyces turgidiscabies TaxID=85558 RepID=UPI0038F6B107
MTGLRGALAGRVALPAAVAELRGAGELLVVRVHELLQRGAEEVGVEALDLPVLRLRPRPPRRP